MEQSVKKPRLAAPSGGGGGGIVGPAVSGESETAAAPLVSKQEEQMLRVSVQCIKYTVYTLSYSSRYSCFEFSRFFAVSSVEFCR